jgi:hypothetical protein
MCVCVYVCLSEEKWGKKKRDEEKQKGGGCNDKSVA